MREKLNLGCGVRTHPEWRNLDVDPRAAGVERWDITRRLPCRDSTVAAVYLSHVLEHLRPQDALPLMRDCARVLRPGGVLRVVVPDLEGICQGYLDALSATEEGQPGASQRHAWMTLELLDQLVRETSGGRMVDHIRNASSDHAAFLKRRLGEEMATVLADGASPQPRRWLRAVGRALLGTRRWQALSAARFRLGGEVHRWMYDRASLARLVEDAGFQGFRRVDAVQSRIPQWPAFQLDADAAGTPHKPDSLYVEAVKPGGDV